MQWYTWQLSCNKCKQPASLSEVLFSADGELVLKGKCEPCDEEITARTTGASLISMATMADFEARLARQTNIAKQPSTLVRNPVEKDKDDDWLKELGVRDE